MTQGMIFPAPAGPAALLLQLVNEASLPAGAALFCLLVFMAGERKRGRGMLWALSGAASLNTILKVLFRVPRPWLMHAESAPFLAEGGYAFPCLHVQLTAAVFGLFLLTSGRNYFVVQQYFGWYESLVAKNAQNLAEAFNTTNTSLLGIPRKISGNTEYSDLWLIIPGILLFLSGGFAAVFCRDPWGLGLFLTAGCLLLIDGGLARSEKGRTGFGRLYGTVLAAGTYIGLYIFIPFLVEWLVTPFWPGQVLIVFLLTFLPCLYRLFPCF